jgi:hypothetical protein
MNHRVQRLKLELVKSVAAEHRAMAQYPPPSIFNRIPPERIGLQGEYDHSGLAKRVLLVFRQQFGAEAVANLEVSQRGRVVILEGYLDNRHLLHSLAKTALRVEGAAFIEYAAITFSQAA